MKTMKQGSWKNWTIGAVLAGGLVFAGGAQADDRHARHDHDRHVGKGHVARHDVGRDRLRQARQENRRLDQRGALIDLHFDGLALLASANGDYELASVLDRTGDHIERRLNRKGHRQLKQARREVRAHQHSRHCGHDFRALRPNSHRHHAKHQVRNDHRGAKRYAKYDHRKKVHRKDRKQDHADWLADRASDAKRDGRNPKGERWND